MSQIASLVIGSLVGIGLLTAGVKYLKNNSENGSTGPKYQYTNTGMSDEGLTDYTEGYTPKFNGGRNKTKRKQMKPSKKNK